MSNEVNKILDDEQNVKAPILKSIISNEVQTELNNMRNQVKNSQRKIDEANKKLASLQKPKTSSKDRAVSKFLKTTANSDQTLNSNPKEKVKNQHVKSQLISTPTSSEKSTHPSNSNSNSNEKDTIKTQSSTRDIAQERKDKKRKRNLRQRENRKRKKLESLDDPNFVNENTEEKN